MPVLGCESMASQDLCLLGYGAEYMLPAPPAPSSWEKAPEHAYPGYMCRNNLDTNNLHVKYNEGSFTGRR